MKYLRRNTFTWEDVVLGIIVFSFVAVICMCVGYALIVWLNFFDWMSKIIN